LWKAGIGETPPMIRTTLAVCAAVALIVLPACGGNGAAQTTSTATTTAASTPAVDDANAAQRATLTQVVADFINHYKRAALAARPPRKGPPRTA
jgi:hypothetical protein